MEGVPKPKGRRFQKSISTRKENSKVPTTGIEEKVIHFGKQKHAAEFMKNCEVLDNFVTVNYKHDMGPKWPWPSRRCRNQ